MRLIKQQLNSYIQEGDMQCNYFPNETKSKIIC